jgi:hypothetical protein
MANATSTQLQELYVAYFGRAADPTGLDYWTEKGITTTKFAADMYAQAEFKNAYGSLTTEAQVNQIYKNLFDREADVTGLTYWTQQINLGNLQLAEIATHLIWAAQNNSGSSDDKTALTNRTNAAVAYTAKVKESTAAILAYAAESTGDTWVEGDNIAEAKSYMSGIDKDTTHTAAGIAASVTTITNNGVQSTKLSFTGTTSVDSFTGGTGNDTFTFDNTGTDTSSTADTLVGGAGTDTLKIYSDGTADPLPALTTIETLNIYDLDAALDLSGNDQSSLTSVTLTRGDGALGLTIGAAVTTVNLADFSVSGAGGDAGIVITHATADTAAIIGLDDVLVAGNDADENIDLDGAGLTSATFNVTTTSTTDVIDVAGASTITINATGALTASSLTTTSTTAALTITGAGAVGIGTVDNGIDSLTASSATGAQTFTAPADNTAFVATLGSGADVVTVNDEGFATTAAFNIDAGAGTDVLIADADGSAINTADEGGRYDNFETIRTGTSQDVSLISGITAIQLTAADTTTLSGLNATNMASIQFRADNATSTTFTPTDATGSSDAITLSLKSTTATTTVDLVGIAVANIETVNIASETGSTSATATTSNAFGFLANSADSVTAINITGDSDVTFTVAANTLDVVAVTIDASGMTGVGDLELVQTSDLVTGSTVTGSSNGDTIALGTTLGSTYNLGAGNDGASTVLATLVADGTSDTVLNMGAGTDTLTISDTAPTLTDNHFTNVSNAEELTTTGAGAISITTGSAFTSAFASGVTVTAANGGDDDSFVFSGGLYDQATTIAYTTTQAGDATDAGEDVTITTGDAADTITITASSFVGGNGADGAAISVSTDAGADTITITTGTLHDQTTSEALTIDAGTGADTITLVTTTNTQVVSAANIVVAAGDSLTSAYDTITGFDLADGTNCSMEIQFDGTAAVTDFSNTVDFGTIKSHSLSNGVATFDDVTNFTTALVISSSNLDDVVGYLVENTDALDTVGFLYDSTGNNANDAIMVYNNGTVTDSLLLLKSNDTLTGLTATNTTKTDNYLAIT